MRLGIEVQEVLSIWLQYLTIYLHNLLHLFNVVVNDWNLCQYSFSGTIVHVKSRVSCTLSFSRNYLRHLEQPLLAERPRDPRILCNARLSHAMQWSKTRSNDRKFGSSTILRSADSIHITFSFSTKGFRQTKLS